MPKITMLQRLAQKNALFNSMYQNAKNSGLITRVYTFFYKKSKSIKKIPTMHLMQQSSDLIQRIYGRLGNDYSKKMYINRLLYNMTGDWQYMGNVIKMTKEGSLFAQKLRDAQNNNKNIFIFSEDLYWWGDDLPRLFNDITFCGCVNNNPKEKKYKNLPVLSFEEYLQQKDNSVILIVHHLLYKTHYLQLKENGVKEENIINCCEISFGMAKRQYFDLPELRSVEKEHEIFVDCGSYDGETSKIFTDWHGNKKATVYAFEADPQNIVRCEKNFEEIKKHYTGGGGYNFSLFPLGVWDSKTILKFSAAGDVGSYVVKDGDIKIPVDSLDNVLKDKEVTFIKMDIEGSECQALIGASKLIKKYKPKLAICIYHKYDDLLTIPEIILNLNPNYTFYVDHYTLISSDTILYAI